MKSQLILVALTILLLPVMSRAKQVSGFIELPGYQPATYTVDTRSGEYNLDYRPLISPRFILSRSEIKSWHCSDLDHEIKVMAPLFKNQIVTSSQPVQLALTGVDRSEIESAIQSDLAQKGIDLPKLIDKSLITIQSIDSKLTWSNHAATVLAGPNSITIAAPYFKALLNQQSVRVALANQKQAVLEVRHLPLLCDLARNRVAIKVSLQGAQFNTLRKWTTITSTQITTANQILLKLDSAMRKIDQADYANSSYNRSTIAPMLLGMAMARSGITPEITGPSDMLSIAGVMLDEFNNPVRLGNQRVQQLIDQLSLRNMSGKNYQVNQSLNVEVR